MVGDALQITEYGDETIAIVPPSDSHGIRWAAALSSARIGYTVALDIPGPLLVVSSADIDRAREEISAYETVNRDWPPPPATVDEGMHETSVLSSVVVVGLLLLAYLKVGAVGGSEFSAGTAVLDSVAVTEGQFWRLATALGLHADNMHLLANCACILVFASATAGQLGFGSAWLAIFGAGVAGNGLSVLLARAPFRAVGASTAVFAAVGILVVLRSASLWHQGWRAPRSFFEPRWVPLVAGMAILAILGGSPDSHLAGHLYGFIAGSIMGCLVLPLRSLKNWALLQQLLFAAFLVANVLVWWNVG